MSSRYNALLKTLTVVGLLSSLIGCGFQLSSHSALPTALNPLYIQYHPQDAQTAIALKKNLSARGITLANTPKQAAYVLNLIQVTENSRLSGSGNIQETRLYYLSTALSYTVSTPKGKSIYGPIHVSSSTPLYVYSGQVLGNNEETVNIFKELRKANVQKLILTLSSEQAHAHFSQSTPTPPSKNG